MFHSPLRVAIGVYLLTFIVLYIVKPKIMFTKHKKMREFGTTNEKTILPIWLVGAIVGILSYIISVLIKHFLRPLYDKIVQYHLDVDMDCD
ncbi:MAG: hypothetical protein CMB80_30275 [Flammeovirgaceae bacterium]|nr:hypothetical protein [Flammeovirgaceae bacterium]|tara:strand:+ start:1383 stop:1655 length:273 start_codon:yes stop_codon:yes gene_type:complete